MTDRFRGMGLVAPILLLILLAGPAASARAARPAAELASLQSTGDTITICHANPSETTPYGLRIVLNDATYQGHLAHLDRPIDLANRSWPDIIPAPQDESGTSYCPDSPPAAPETPTIAPTAPSTVPATVPATDPPTVPPTAPATMPATVPPTVDTTVPPTGPSASIPPTGTASVAVTPGATATTTAISAGARAATPAVTTLPVTGAGPTANSGALWLVLAVLALLPGALAWRRRPRR